MVLNLESTIYIVDGMIPTNYSATTIVLTSPKRKITKAIKKLRTWESYYMPTWSISEVEDACNSLYYSRSINDAKEIYDFCGGIAHYIFEWKKEKTLQEMESAVKTCDLDKIINFIGDTDAPHDTSHMIMHMVVDPQTFQQYKVQFASSIIREKIYQRFLNEQKYSLHNFLKACEDESVAGGIHGNLFEEFSHKMLKGDGKYEIKLLESEEGNPQRKKLELNSGASASLINELNLTVKGIFKFSKLEQITTEHQGFYCYPSIHSFESIDAFIPGTRSSNHRLFQMTISNLHPIKQNKVNKLIKHLNELQNETKEAELYFAIPDEIYSTFNKQKFQTKQRNDAKRTPPIVYSIKQYSLKIPLDANMMAS
nr:10231_t:CDS:1 [Entrophospora candida]